MQGHRGNGKAHGHVHVIQGLLLRAKSNFLIPPHIMNSRKITPLDIVGSIFVGSLYLGERDSGMANKIGAAEHHLGLRVWGMEELISLVVRL